MILEDVEFFDGESFATLPTRQFIVSLKVIAEWEGEFERPFFNRNVEHDDLLWKRLMELSCVDCEAGEIDKYFAYWFPPFVEGLQQPLTAKKFKPRPGVVRDIYNEDIYAAMANLGIPFIPCENWPIQRIFSLINVMNNGQEDGSRRASKKEYALRRAEINAMRRGLL